MPQLSYEVVAIYATSLHKRVHEIPIEYEWLGKQIQPCNCVKSPFIQINNDTDLGSGDVSIVSLISTRRRSLMAGWTVITGCAVNTCENVGRRSLLLDVCVETTIFGEPPSTSLFLLASGNARITAGLLS